MGAGCAELAAVHAGQVADAAGRGLAADHLAAGCVEQAGGLAELARWAAG